MRTPDFILDCGNNQVTLLNTLSDEVIVLTKDEALELPNKLPPKSYVVGENSHFGVPRTKKSRSQYFYAKQLEKWYRAFRDNKIILRLAPEKLTPRANALMKEFKNSDEKDVRGWKLLLEKHPNITLKKPNYNIDQPEGLVSPLRQEGWNYRQETTWILNGCRGGQLAYADPNDLIVAFLKDNFMLIWQQLTDDEKRLIDWPITLDDMKKCKGNGGWTCGKTDSKKGLVKGQQYLENVNNSKLLYTLVSMFLDSDPIIGLRTRKDNPYCTNEQPGIDFLMTHVVVNTPHHLKGGVASSNIKFWWLRNRIKRLMACTRFNTTEPTKDQVSYMGMKGRDGKFAPDSGKTIKLEDGTTKKYKSNEFIEESVMTPQEDAEFVKLRNNGTKLVRKLLQIIKPMTKNWIESRQESRAQLETV